MRGDFGSGGDEQAMSEAACALQRRAGFENNTLFGCAVPTFAQFTYIRFPVYGRGAFA